MQWWTWIVAGLVLMGFELVTPGGFVLLFFGIAAVLVGALSGIGFGMPTWLELVLFSALSLISLAMFRRPLLNWMQSRSPKTGDVDSMTGQSGVALEILAPNSTGKIELRGTGWTGKNIGSTPIAKGDRCVVASVDGLTLNVNALERKE